MNVTHSPCVNFKLQSVFCCPSSLTRPASFLPHTLMDADAALWKFSEHVFFVQEQRRERFNPRHPTRRSELRGFCHIPGRRSVDTRSEQPRNYRNGHRTASLLHTEELHWVQRGHETSSLWGKFRLKLKKLIRCENKRGLRHSKTKLR